MIPFHNLLTPEGFMWEHVSINPHEPPNMWCLHPIGFLRPAWFVTDDALRYTHAEIIPVLFEEFFRQAEEFRLLAHPIIRA